LLPNDYFLSQQKIFLDKVSEDHVNIASLRFFRWQQDAAVSLRSDLEVNGSCGKWAKGSAGFHITAFLELSLAVQIPAQRQFFWLLV
jgi:hypothetical protein